MKLSVPILLATLLAVGSTNALADTSYATRIPLRGLALSAANTTPSETSPATSSPVTPAPEIPAPPPQKYTLQPGSNESFEIPAGATGLSYAFSVTARSGTARYEMYRDDVRIYGTGCTCSSTWGTYTESNPFVQLTAGHTYRFNVTTGTLTLSKLTYTH